MKNKRMFLEETAYCDFSHPKIRKLNKKITTGCQNNKAKAKALFDYTRDSIPYKFGNWGKKASKILEQKSGMCTNKAVLLVSLLRANGIPAGFGILKVKGQEYFGPIAIPMLKKRVGKESVHIYVYVNLDNKWFKIDPSADRLLSEKTSYFSYTTEFVEWDGRSDAMENLDPKTILKDSGPFFNIDKKLQKKPKNGKGIILKVGNVYLDFLRKNKQIIKNIGELESLFVSWLKKEHVVYFFLFKCVSTYKDFKIKLNGKK